jgi:hypothetical protein
MAEKYRVIGTNKVNQASQVTGDESVQGLPAQAGDWLVTDGTHAQVLTDVQFRERYAHEDGTPLEQPAEPHPKLNRTMDPYPTQQQLEAEAQAHQRAIEARTHPSQAQAQYGTPPHVQHPGGAPMVAGGPPQGGPQPPPHAQGPAQGAPVQHQPGVHPPPSTGPQPPTGRR